MRPATSARVRACVRACVRASQANQGANGEKLERGSLTRFFAFTLQPSMQPGRNEFNPVPLLFLKGVGRRAGVCYSNPFRSVPFRA